MSGESLPPIVKALHPPQPPPPPPPPPPPILSARKTAKKLLWSSKCERKLAESHVVQTLCRKTHQRVCSSNKSIVFVSSFRDIEPVLQDGPMCGLVALCMAGQITGKSKHCEPADVLQCAKNIGYTLQGEMFSASNMSHLAKRFLECDTSVIRMAPDSWRDITEHLVNGCPLLIPYDADANHEPCLKKGHKAHWALITGCVLTITDSDLGNNYTSDADEKWLYHIQAEESLDQNHHGHCIPSAAIIDSILPRCSVSDIYVYAAQGKSRYISLWSLSSLISSNSQLVEPGPKIESRLDEWILPTEGIQFGLASQVVVLYPTSPS